MLKILHILNMVNIVLALRLVRLPKEETSQLSSLEWKVGNKLLLNYLFFEEDINKYRPNELNYDKSRDFFR